MAGVQALDWLGGFFNGADAAPPGTSSGDVGLDREKDNLRLRTLVLLRWLAILGQTAMVLLVAYGFRFHIRTWLCLAVIMASLWLNVLLALGRRGHSIRPWEAALQLSFDAIQLSVLLGVTGGLNNPFCLMLVAPATVAAANLPTRHGLAVVVVSMVASLSLVFWSLDLPWTPGQTFELPAMYRFGFLAAILIGIVFTAGYAWQAALESRRMEQALAATRAVLEQEARLSALGSLAASAAHELGTPLGTIQVVAKEMLQSLKPASSLYEDAELLVSQSQRCRDILKRLAQKPETQDAVYEQMPLKSFLELAAAPYAAAKKSIVIEIAGEDAEHLTIRRRPEWQHALTGFIENAVDFAHTTVWVRAELTAAYVALTIEDDGPGFSPDILSRLGEPYISSRVYGEDSHSGMGLGFFIAKTLLEHTGAGVSFGNREDGGAFVRALWRRGEADILLPEA